MINNLTCIECPIGCELEVQVKDNEIIVKGNGCPRGKLYAQTEMTCPKRVITSTVRALDGQMIPVKTDKPVRKEMIFEVMAKINATTCVLPVAVGDILVENICDDANLVVSGNF